MKDNSLVERMYGILEQEVRGRAYIKAHREKELFKDEDEYEGKQINKKENREDE